MAFTLKGIEVTNLRGYRSSSLALSRKVSFIVGPNNAGKTSVIKLLNWFLNECDDDLLKGYRTLTQEEYDFIVPARDTRHKARRLSLLVYVSDGRSHGRYECVDGVARLRLNIKLTPSRMVYLALGYPSKGEAAESTDNALKLYKYLKNSILFIHIPSFREGTSLSFKKTLLQAFQRRLSTNLIHRGQGGVTTAERKYNDAIKSIQELSRRFALPLWQDLKKYLPPGMIKDADVSLPVSPEAMIDRLCEQLSIRLSTGEHDNKKVPIAEVGAGLQSLLELVINLSEADAQDRRVIIAMEEPEAFLHPAAQRTVARNLRSIDIVDRVVVTTHSPIVVEEAKFGEVVICQDQKFYEPKQERWRRESINSALLSGYGAEMVFASSVLLVEGDGDRQFFERLRRRLTTFDATGRVDKMFVVSVGSNTQFAPWLRLLNSYGSGDDRPIKWLVVPDGDSRGQLRRAFTDAGVVLPKDTAQHLSNIPTIDSSSQPDVPGWRQALSTFNDSAKQNGVRTAFLDVDLEYTMLADAEDDFLVNVADEADLEFENKEQMLTKLGSKSQWPRPQRDDCIKAPWLRGYIGENIHFSQLTSSARYIIKYWMTGVMSETDAENILRRARREEDSI